jgi:predicted RNA binding protein YcfA (HicA-like mRNA interferase family)
MWLRMPKLPIVSGTETVRALERLGFTVVRQRGSHMVLRRGASGCVVPDHREIKVGTLRGILKQAGVSTEEFITALRT